MALVLLGVRHDRAVLPGRFGFLPLAILLPNIHECLPEELAAIQSGLNVAGEQARSSGELVPWKRVVRSREVWAVTISYFCYGYVAWIFFSWFYRYLAKVRGLDLKASAVLFHAAVSGDAGVLPAGRSR